MIFKLLTFMTCPIAFQAVSGCGSLQPGREKTVNYTLSGFKIPAVMAYTEDAGAKMRFPAISSTMSEAVTFVRMLIMRPVEDVLYEQGRSAFLPDVLISSILQQFDVEISYEPLKCENVISTMGMAAIGMKLNCVIVDGTVTGICIGTMDTDCEDMQKVLMNSKSIDSKHFSISGSFKTSNGIMANWSNQMWESVLNRVLRRITAGPNRSYFYGASVNVR